MAEATPNPIDEKITTALHALLTAIKPENGYTGGDLKPVRVTQGMDETANHGDCVVFPDEERRFKAAGDPDFENAYSPTIQWIQTYRVRVFAKISDNSDTPIDRALARFAADIRKAIMQPDANTGARGSLGGLAMQTIPIGKQFNWASKPYYLDLIFDVHYKTFASDPYKFTD